MDRGLGDVLAKARETRAAKLKEKKVAPLKKAAPAKKALFAKATKAKTVMSKGGKERFKKYVG